MPALTDEQKQAYVGRVARLLLGDGGQEVSANRNGTPTISVKGQGANVLR